MSEIRVNNISGTASGNAMTLSSAGATSCTWTSAPAFPTIASPDFAKIILEPDTANEEVVYLTAFTSGATSGTVTRAQEGSAAITHSAVSWVHGPTANDFKSSATRLFAAGHFR